MTRLSTFWRNLPLWKILLIALPVLGCLAAFGLYNRENDTTLPQTSAVVIIPDKTEVLEEASSQTDDIGGIIDRLLLEEKELRPQQESDMPEDVALSVENQSETHALEESLAEVEPLETKFPDLESSKTEVTEAKITDATTVEQTSAKTEVTEAKSTEGEPTISSAENKAIAIADKADLMLNESADSAQTESTSSDVPDTAQNIPDTAQNDVPLLAIVIDDMGINQARTKDIASLQAPITSSFLTYGQNLNTLAMRAVQNGHELMIHAPMEPKGPASLAPDTLMVGMENQDLANRFISMLHKFEDLPVRGINNHMGSRFTENAEKLSVVMPLLKQKNLFFLDSKTTAASKARESALENGIDYVARDVFLDNTNEAAYIRKQLAQAINIARKKGFAVAIGHPKSQTYAVLKEWLAQKDDSVRLVPLSQIVGKTRNP